ncbi:O-antigen ligase family protein [Dokdonella sp.]|uniref:O-antigen ligase family protein n=1 Tax=Dokdonella sp. TaxID=2291710 RepID=UPI0031C11B8C|nr:O-antigen ligase family protein [Dokdonella sp.]
MSSPPLSRFPWPALVVLAVLVLLPVGRTAELPLLVGLVAGIVLLARGRLAPADPALRLALALFACYWLPALLSAPLSVAPQKSWSTAAAILRFLPFAGFAAWALREAALWPALRAGIATVVALWVIDAWVQMATGYSLGGAAEAERISGIFGADNLKLGPVLAVLSPFVLLAAAERGGRAGLLLAMLLVGGPLLLAGSRAAWLSYGLVCLLVGWRAAGSPRRFAAALALFVLAAGALASFALHDSTRFNARLDRSLLALQGTPDALDAAAAGRLRIWDAALSMFAAHPLTGVGVRGFRYAYPDHAAPGDSFVDAARGTGASHAHQIVLEVASETGLVGLLGWIAGTVIAWRAWRRADAPARARARAPALALLAMCFPLNTHLAFYSAWWGLLFWWLLALYCAALGARAGLPPTPGRILRSP